MKHSVSDIYQYSVLFCTAFRNRCSITEKLLSQRMKNKLFLQELEAQSQLTLLADDWQQFHEGCTVLGSVLARAHVLSQPILEDDHETSFCSVSINHTFVRNFLARLQTLSHQKILTNYLVQGKVERTFLNKGIILFGSSISSKFFILQHFTLVWMDFNLYRFLLIANLLFPIEFMASVNVDY